MTDRDSISVFAIDPETGLVERTSNHPTGVQIPRNITLTPSGSHIVVSGQASNRLSVLKVSESDGSLELVSKSDELPQPMCVTFRSLGR